MLTRQQRQTDLAGLEMHVRVAYRRDELHGRWAQWVVRWNGETEEPQAAGVGAGLVAGAFQDGLPVVQVFVAGGAEMEDRVVGVRT